MRRSAATVPALPDRGRVLPVDRPRYTRHFVVLGRPVHRVVLAEHLHPICFSAARCRAHGYAVDKEHRGDMSVSFASGATPPTCTSNYGGMSSPMAVDGDKRGLDVISRDVAAVDGPVTRHGGGW